MRLLPQTRGNGSNKGSVIKIVGFDHGAGHLRSRCGMPPYATRRFLQCCVAGPLCHEARKKRDRRVLVPATIRSIRTRAPHCLIFPCKIPANVPDHPRRGAPRWPRESRRTTPESSRPFSSGTLDAACEARLAGHGIGSTTIPVEGSPAGEARSERVYHLSGTL